MLLVGEQSGQASGPLGASALPAHPRTATGPPARSHGSCPSPSAHLPALRYDEDRARHAQLPCPLGESAAYSVSAPLPSPTSSSWRRAVSLNPNPCAGSLVPRRTSPLRGPCVSPSSVQGGRPVSASGPGGDRNGSTDRTDSVSLLPQPITEPFEFAVVSPPLSPHRPAPALHRRNGRWAPRPSNAVADSFRVHDPRGVVRGRTAVMSVLAQPLSRSCRNFARRLVNLTAGAR
ncbi:hypothetical protein SAMN05428942_0456 [Streptomyces sp. 2112.2]|nr:hypothetical protein SAMN05428942_0456 [Streptomyces sp. 2112.2]